MRMSSANLGPALPDKGVIGEKGAGQLSAIGNPHDKYVIGCRSWDLVRFSRPWQVRKRELETSGYTAEEITLLCAQVDRV
jgi:hypothetical protein